MDRNALTAFLSGAGFRLRTLEPLAGDVSPRRYARIELETGVSVIAAAYPVELGDACARFERSTALLEGIGVRVPRILTADCGRGWMLLEDLGPETLFDRLAGGGEPELRRLEESVDAAARIATLDRDEVAALNPPLDPRLLWRELRQTVDLYLRPHGLLGADDGQERRSLGALERLCEALGAAEPVPCHRDFMARNLVPTGSGIAVLDHQDLRLGPPGYDLASLLNDSFFPADEMEDHLLNRGAVAGEGVSYYQRAALQRTLKAIGTFAAFARRGSDRHLPLIAPTLERARLHLPRVAETAEIAGYLEPLWARHLENARN